MKIGNPITQTGIFEPHLGKRHSYQWLVWVLLLLLTPLPGPAEVIDNLYETEIAVASQSQDERNAALAAAMRQVLLRVSGRNIVLTITAIENALGHPTRYVQQYRYRAGTDEAKEQILWVRFDENAINGLLRDNRMPVWGKTRPGVLLWMVVDDRNTRELIGNNVNHPAGKLMLEQARLRGLPLHLPMLDLADSANLNTGDVWGNFEDTILQASRRYQTEAVLVGRVYQTSTGSWSVRWTLYDSSRRDDWDTRAESLVEALIPGIDNTASTLAQRFARADVEGTDSKVLVQVYGIDDLAGYNKAVQYLAGLSVVTEVQPHSVFRDNVIYELQSRSGRLALSQAISLGHTLVASDRFRAPRLGQHQGQPTSTDQFRNNTAVPAAEKQITADLVYQLIP